MTTSMYGPSPTETWSQRPMGAGAGHLRAMGKVRLRLRQSAPGYALAVELAGSPPIERFAAQQVSDRVDTLSRFEEVVWDSTPVKPLADIAGSLHRWWMSRVASNSTAMLLREIDRGEASLERAIRDALRRQPRRGAEHDSVSDDLHRLLVAVTAARRRIEELPTALAGPSA